MDERMANILRIFLQNAQIGRRPSRSCTRSANIRFVGPPWQPALPTRPAQPSEYPRSRLQPKRASTQAPERLDPTRHPTSATANPIPASRPESPSSKTDRDDEHNRKHDIPTCSDIEQNNSGRQHYQNAPPPYPRHL